MSQNLDLVRSIYAAIERGDYSSAEWAHPQIEYVVPDGPDPGSFAGPEGMARAMRSIFSAFADVRTEAEEFHELDAVRVLVLARGSGRGKTSGAQGEHRTAEVFEIHDGKVTRIVNYFDREHALADLGLTEQAMPANLDLVRSIYAGWERGDFSKADWAHPEIEFVIVDGPEPSSGTGLAWLADAMRAWLSAWADFRSEAEECRELDNERVLILAAYTGRGKTSGLGVAQMRGQGAALFHVHGGRVTRLVVYIDRDRGLADLGLATERSRDPAEKLRLAERSYAAFSPLDIDAIIPLFHPECEWRMAPGRAIFGTDAYRGQDGLRELVFAIDEGAESYAAEIDEARITREGVLLLSNTTQARSRATHIELSSRGWQKIEFRGGLILSVAQFDGPPPGWEEATPIT